MSINWKKTLTSWRRTASSCSPRPLKLLMLKLSNILARPRWFKDNLRSPRMARVCSFSNSDLSYSTKKLCICKKVTLVKVEGGLRKSGRKQVQKTYRGSHCRCYVVVRETVRKGSNWDTPASKKAREAFFLKRKVIHIDYVIRRSDITISSSEQLRETSIMSVWFVLFTWGCLLVMRSAQVSGWCSKLPVPNSGVNLTQSGT